MSSIFDKNLIEVVSKPISFIDQIPNWAKEVNPIYKEIVEKLYSDKYYILDLDTSILTVEKSNYDENYYIEHALYQPSLSLYENGRRDYYKREAVLTVTGVAIDLTYSESVYCYNDKYHKYVEDEINQINTLCTSGVLSVLPKDHHFIDVARECVGSKYRKYILDWYHEEYNRVSSNDNHVSDFIYRNGKFLATIPKSEELIRNCFDEKHK